MAIFKHEINLWKRLVYYTNNECSYTVIYDQKWDWRRSILALKCNTWSPHIKMCVTVVEK